MNPHDCTGILMTMGAKQVMPAHQRADESVASHFSRLMKASTSRFGVWTDPAIVALTMAVPLMGVLVARKVDAPPHILHFLQAAVGLPIVCAVAVTLALSRARAAVVNWLASLPFPVENMNAILNGLGEELEISFRGDTGAAPGEPAELPTRELLNAELDRVHTDCFVTDVAAEARTFSLRIGVVEAKYNPSGSNYRRYMRTRQVVETVLVPLNETHPIASVRVK